MTSQAAEYLPGMCQVLANAVINAESDEAAASVDTVFIEIFSGPRAPLTEAVRRRLGQPGLDKAVGPAGAEGASEASRLGQGEDSGSATILPGPGAWDRPGASDRGGEHVRPQA